MDPEHLGRFLSSSVLSDERLDAGTKTTPRNGVPDKIVGSRAERLCFTPVLIRRCESEQRAMSEHTTISGEYPRFGVEPSARGIHLSSCMFGSASAMVLALSSSPMKSTRGPDMAMTGDVWTATRHEECRMCESPNDYASIIDR